MVFNGKGKMREFESIWLRYLKSGFAGFVGGKIASTIFGGLGTALGSSLGTTAVGGTSTSAAATAAVKGSAAAGGSLFGGLGWLIGVPFALIFYSGYRYNSDKCRKHCGKDEQCYNKCYLQASEGVVKQIQKEIGNLSKVKNPEVKAKTKKKLEKELKKWKERTQKYKSRLH